MKDVFVTDSIRYIGIIAKPHSNRNHLSLPDHILICRSDRILHLRCIKRNTPYSNST